MVFKVFQGENLTDGQGQLILKISDNSSRCFQWHDNAATNPTIAPKIR